MQLQVQQASPGGAPPLVSAMFDGYGCPAGAYDEAFVSPGVPRPHWAKFLSDLAACGKDEISLRWENGQTILRDHGVTYNTYDGLEDVERPWNLDLIPFIIDPEEWLRIERGVIQRTRLLNRILNDTYTGRQMLIRDGLLPPALIFANPSFIRPCRGIGNSGRPYLSLHSIDLIRNAAGSWQVLGDRTQAMNGIGYSLENRTIVSRILPEMFRAQGVRRLNQFFGELRDSLSAIERRDGDMPRIVLLSPGTRHEAYYEHTMMARYLGITLVEGGDLTVRNREVHLKTLEGLQKVDVILRRVDDVFCDPLELRSDSFLGVAGLTESLRAGNITISNALGASLAESPALLPFLPRLCNHYFGEQLELSSGDAWWCGEAEALSHVISNLGSMLIRPAFPPVAAGNFDCPGMNGPELEELGNSIRANPHTFVAQSPVTLSHAPAWVDGRLVPCPIVLRVFVASIGADYVVMPGGLTRISSSLTSPGLNLQFSVGSKDTWIANVGERDLAPASILLENRQTGRTTGGVPSRTADNLYWLGRYSERLEHTVRVLRTTLSRHINEPTQRSISELATLEAILGELFVGDADVPDAEALPLEERILGAIYARGVAGGIVELVDRIGDIASQARDRFSGDTWRILNKLTMMPGPRPQHIPATKAYALTHDLIGDLAALSGMEMENMTRGYDWRFLDFGRRIERLMNMGDLIRCALSSGGDQSAILHVLLEAADSSMTYRRTHYAEPTVTSVLELLMLNVRNPRSIAFQLARMIDHIEELPGDPATGEGGSELDALRALQTDSLTLESVEQLANWVSPATMNDLELWFTRLNLDLAEVSDRLTQRYFNLTMS